MLTIRRYLEDTSGTTAIEYSLIAAGIALAIVSIVNAIGTKVKAPFTTVSNALG